MWKEYNVWAQTVQSTESHRILLLRTKWPQTCCTPPFNTQMQCPPPPRPPLHMHTTFTPPTLHSAHLLVSPLARTAAALPPAIAALLPPLPFPPVVPVPAQHSTAQVYNQPRGVSTAHSAIQRKCGANQSGVPMGGHGAAPKHTLEPARPLDALLMPLPLVLLCWSHHLCAAQLPACQTTSLAFTSTLQPSLFPPTCRGRACRPSCHPAPSARPAGPGRAGRPAPGHHTYRQAAHEASRHAPGVVALQLCKACAKAHPSLLPEAACRATTRAAPPCTQGV